MLIDIHTHACSHDPLIKEIEALDARVPMELHIPRTPFCYGIHPWHVGEVDFNSFKSSFAQMIQNANFFAMGEIGLDRGRKDTWELQLEVLGKQLELVDRWRIPRLVIHCVKSEFDLLPLLKKLKRRPWIIFHAFNGNLETVQAFKKDLNCFFSFGSSLFNENGKAAQSFQQLELANLFLETDDQLKYGIRDIYEQAARLRGIPVSELEAQLEANYSRLLS